MDGQAREGAEEAAVQFGEFVHQPLETLVQAIRACRICRDTPLGPPLPHEPRPVLRIGDGSAPILICGQAPGTKVQESGVPFDDMSGDTLRNWLGVDRDTFYDPDSVAVVPMGFCFPGLSPAGADLPPRPSTQEYLQ
jgi:uracil-DNA glycosylase